MEKSAMQPWMRWGLTTVIVVWGVMIVLSLMARHWWVAADLAVFALLTWVEAISRRR